MPDLIKDTRYLRTKEAAHYVGLSARTKIGGRVVYTLEELRAWADSGSCASTSDPNNANVSPPVRRAGTFGIAGRGRA